MVELPFILAQSGLALENMAASVAVLAQQPTIEPMQWTRSFAALLAIVVVGLALIASILAWGRRMRRLLRRSRGPSRMSQDNWYAKPLVPDADDARDKSGD